MKFSWDCFFLSAAIKHGVFRKPSQTDQHADHVPLHTRHFITAHAEVLSPMRFVVMCISVLMAISGMCRYSKLPWAGSRLALEEYVLAEL